jgi:hypothetical protein
MTKKTEEKDCRIRFTPEKDITVYELAWILSDKWGEISIPKSKWETLSPEIKKYFVRIY